MDPPAALPPDPRKFPRPVPTLATLYRVERVILLATRKGEEPLSLEEIKRRMGSKWIRYATIRTCIDHLQREGKVIYDPGHGVFWARLSPQLAKRFEGAERIA